MSYRAAKKPATRRVRRHQLAAQLDRRMVSSPTARSTISAVEVIDLVLRQFGEFDWQPRPLWAREPAVAERERVALSRDLGLIAADGLAPILEDDRRAMPTCGAAIVRAETRVAPDEDLGSC